ncbi:MAG: hypothetical protein LRY41_02880 [Candidatus Pacebacteria bacterium]|nr:hypothetical protein [Candidatus Paceibacterota bacterium]MCD8508006.1 hypothetical protein [Candidatus Paceibacterota bacterium]MCD8528241.1 hypothetical protein [Candidatus Paceibacterota bacterium]MCD8564052.1 hypothetical protein [Candidatus Paceibacterota bacterium]
MKKLHQNRLEQLWALLTGKHVMIGTYNTQDKYQEELSVYYQGKFLYRHTYFKNGRLNTCISRDTSDMLLQYQWYENGQLRAHFFYPNPAEYHILIWHPNGKLHTKEIYDRSSGTNSLVYRKIYYPTGICTYILERIGSKRAGRLRIMEWDENGLRKKMTLINYRTRTRKEWVWYHTIGQRRFQKYIYASFHWMLHTEEYYDAIRLREQTIYTKTLYPSEPRIKTHMQWDTSGLCTSS